MLERKSIEDLARSYPPDVVDRQLLDVDRIVFHVGLARSLVGEGGTLVDLGGGVGMMSLGCALAGLNPVVVDDFNDPINRTHGDSILDLHRRAGVQIIRRDVVADSIDFPDGSVDLFTTFESLEHWHNSPKRLLHDAVRALRPGGHLVIGVPNCVNLRKRITTPLGRAKWSTMQDWYEEPIFRGHVREPDIADLRYIAADLDLEVVDILGRNWMAYVSPRRWVRRLVPIVDRVLRPFPALCSDIYLVARKPG
jgi:SAM-dependent methyltransferase